MADAHRLDPLFNFSSVALVGASDNASMGLRVYQSLQASGFSGTYFPVNARNDRVHGVQAYRNVSSCPQVPEMAIIAIPREGIPDVIDECAEMGVKAAVILAAGFADLDDHGRELQARITQTCRETGLLVVGPNCLGLVSVVNHCAASSTTPPAFAGNVAVLSHSGGLMNEVVSCGVPRGIGFSHVVSAGNEAGVTAADIIDYYIADSRTDVILCILETARDPGGFAAACSRALAARKPVVALKMGWSEKGRVSAFTHTGANSGNDAVYDAVFREKGVIRVNDIDELVDMGALLSSSIEVLRRHRLERVAVIEISGGGKELVCDTAAMAGVPLADLSPDAVKALEEQLPDETYPTNPIDTGGSWVQADKAEVYPATLEIFANEPDVDIVVSRYTIPRAGSLGVLRQRMDEYEVARAAHPDRLFPVLSRTCDQYSEEWEAAIRERQIPFVQGYGRGLRALGLLGQYSLAVHGARGAVTGDPSDEPTAPSAKRLDAAQTQKLLAELGVSQAAGGNGVELSFSASRDSQFGLVVSFGLGGDFGEVLDDRSSRLAPISAHDAAAMIDEIRGRRLLDAGRSHPAVNRDAVARVLVGLSDLLQQRPDISSITIPAAFAGDHDVSAAEARVELAS